MIIDHRLLARLQQNPDHRRQLGNGIMDALAAVVRNADHQVNYGGTLRPLDTALEGLQAALQEAFNQVPGVDVPADQAGV